MKLTRWPPRLRGLAMMAVLAMSASPVAAFELHLAQAGLSPAQLAASEQLLRAADAVLPAPLSQRFDMSLQLSWRDDLPEHVVGRARGRELSLDTGLLQAWLADDPGVRQVPRPVLAALLHEIAHALDRSAKGRWSSSARFLDLAGWQPRPLRLGRGDNAFSSRSPDAYERHRPSEFFAVNFEHYLLDPEYHCRRPGLARWFEEEVGPGRAIQPVSCGPELPLVQADAVNGGAQLQWLDPARVYQVDYLLAEGNEQLMSRWGHSMLRLVICAPGRAPGPACRMDLQHHLVLSFRAFVGDVQISSWSGLTGSYPSRLFILPLSQVVEEYTKVELRALSSRPLHLAETEIASLMAQAAQLHWSYDGRYYFVSNNCAVETFKLLQTGVPRLAQLDLSSITPTGLQRRLQDQAVMHPPVQDVEAAVRGGFHFPSAASHYQALFEVVRGEAPSVVGQRTVEQWLALPPGDRRKVVPAIGLRGAAAALVLERAAQRRLDLRLQHLLKREVQRGRLDPGKAVPGLARLLEQAGMLTAPAVLLGEGYGIPLGAERVWVAQQVERLDHEGRAGWDGLREQLQSFLPQAMKAEQQGVRDNLELLGERVRSAAAVPEVS